MNLAKGWEIRDAEVTELIKRGTLPAVWRRGPFMWPGRYDSLGYFSGSLRANPAIDDPYKSTGYPNFNHQDYARISRDLLTGDLALIRSRPDLYARRVGRALAQFAVPGPTLFLVNYDTRRIEHLSAAADSMVPWPMALFALALVIVFGGSRALRRSCASHDRVVLAYLASTIVWLAVCSTLLEVGENDRIRWEIDPLLVVLTGCALSSVTRRPRSDVASPTTASTPRRRRATLPHLAETGEN